MNKKELASYFNDIANNRIKSEVVLEDKQMTCILDVDPINKGHILILPKRKLQEFTELNEIELLSLCEMIKKLSESLERAYRPTGISIMQNGGKNSELNYFHFHVFPRFEDDDFQWKSREVLNYSLDEHREIIVNNL